MENSRSKNAILNIIVGWGSQIGILLLSFVSRRIFIQFLSADYLGINGLYSNILSVLALAELGLGNVTQFFLYKPVAENDHKTINSLVNYFRKLYMMIAMVVLTIGLLLIPLLKYIVNSNLNHKELIIYYILFLLNSCVTYFAADKTALLAANQDVRLTKYVNLGVSIALQVLHIIVLVIWHNFMLYVSATLLSSIVNVGITNCLCYRKYPYLKQKVTEKNSIDKNYIISNLKATFVYKIGATIINNTDNILISVIVSTAAVGLYSNYLMVVNGIQAFLSVVTNSLISGVGNLSANGDKKRMISIFDDMIFFYHFIAAFGSVSFFLLFNEFISIWLGVDYLLDQRTVFAISLSFYMTNAISPVWMFRESNGLFDKVKYLLLSTAFLNIIFSIILGKIYGVFGILLATSIARILTQVVYEPQILFKFIFGTSSKHYWSKQFKYLFLAMLSAAICYGMTSLIPQGFTFIVIKAVLYFVIFVVVFLGGCKTSNEVRELRVFLNKIFRKNRL